MREEGSVERRHVCEEYVTEGKECGNSVAIAMEVGEMWRMKSRSCSETEETCC